MKKITAVFLVMVLCAMVFTGCRNRNAMEDTSVSTSMPAPLETSAPTSAPTTQPTTQPTTPSTANTAPTTDRGNGPLEENIPGAANSTEETENTNRSGRMPRGK